MIASFLCYCFLVAFASGARAQRCDQGQTPITLGFDDIQVAAGDTPALAWPYRDFMFVRTSSYLDRHMVIFNPVGYPDWQKGVASPPNVLLTSGESFAITQVPSKNNRTFVFLNVSMTSIYVDNMGVFIQMSRNGTVLHRMVVTLGLGVRTPIVIDNLVRADRVDIGCVDTSIPTCANVAYDDFSLCYKHT